MIFIILNVLSLYNSNMNSNGPAGRRRTRSPVLYIWVFMPAAASRGHTKGLGVNFSRLSSGRLMYPAVSCIPQCKVHREHRRVQDAGIHQEYSTILR